MKLMEISGEETRKRFEEKKAGGEKQCGGRR
jgi:hypothetical protein